MCVSGRMAEAKRERGRETKDREIEMRTEGKR